MRAITTRRSRRSIPKSEHPPSQGVRSKPLRAYRLLRRKRRDRDRAQDEAQQRQHSSPVTPLRPVSNDQSINLAHNEANPSSPAHPKPRPRPRHSPIPHLKTFGIATLSEDFSIWKLDVEPHVSLKLKQVFRKINTGSKGTLFLSASEENCRDLQWFATRYPLSFRVYLGHSEQAIHDEKLALEILSDRAQSHDKRTQAIFDITNPSSPYRSPPPQIPFDPPARTYQERAASLLVSQGSLLLADCLGSGKTATAIRALAHPNMLPAIVVCPAHLPFHWRNQINKFTPSLTTHILKKSTPYKFKHWPDILITSYHKLRGWSDFLEGRVKTIIFDEAHELRRCESIKYKAAAQVSHSATNRLALTATPILNYGNEFHSVIDVIRPGSLGTREEFIREWCVGGFHEDRKARIKDPPAFGTFLRESGIMLRRTRKDIDRELPSINRIVHEIEVEPGHLDNVKTAAGELARAILDQGKVQSNYQRMQIASEFSNALRQATGIAKAPYIAEFAKMIVEEQDEPVIIFGWHREVYSLLMERLSSYSPAIYTGSESTSKKHKEAERFIRGETPIMIMSLRSGSGLDGLQERACTAIFGELDWSYGIHTQCEGRLHRDGQQRPVFSYYLTSDQGSDPTVLDVLGVKRSQLHGVNDPYAPIMKEMTIDPHHVKKLARAYLNQIST